MNSLNGPGSEAAPFVGVGVALITLFDDSGALDADATAEHAARLVDLGMAAVLVGGTTGEFALLTEAERNELLTAVVKRLHGSACVIAGVGAPSTEEACRLTETATNAGADCILSTPTNGELIEHYRRVKEAAGDLPVLGYHWPQKYPPGIDVDVIDQLPIAGCKDSSGDPKRLLDEVTKSHKAIYCGSSSLPLLCSRIGGAGAILGGANAFPELCVAAFAEDPEAQRQLHIAQDATRTLSFPNNVKQMAAERFGTSTLSRV